MVGRARLSASFPDRLQRKTRRGFAPPDSSASSIDDLEGEAEQASHFEDVALNQRIDYAKICVRPEDGKRRGIGISTARLRRFCARERSREESSARLNAKPRSNEAGRTSLQAFWACSLRSRDYRENEEIAVQEVRVQIRADQPREKRSDRIPVRLRSSGDSSEDPAALLNLTPCRRNLNEMIVTRCLN